MKEGLKINIIGELHSLPSEIKSTLIKTINLTKKNKKFILILQLIMVQKMK